MLKLIKSIVYANNTNYNNEGSISQTTIGSGSLNRLERIIEIVAATNVYDPPITAGNLVPKVDCNNVLIPATKSRVWMTFAFST